MPRSLTFPLCRFGLLVLVLTLSSFSIMAQSLQEYRWKNRVVEIATPSVDDPTYHAQAAALIAVFPGLLERDIIVLTAPTADQFEIKLIGKDGGKKLSRNTLLSAEELFAIIDAMPMRLEEMKDVPKSD